jgi:putative transcriptional regulator
MGQDSSRKDQSRYPAGLAEALGRTIKVLRTDRRMERRELAEVAGISYSGLTAIENGNNAPSSSMLAPIAAALGVRMSQLMEMAEERMEAQDDVMLSLSGPVDFMLDERQMEAIATPPPPPTPTPNRAPGAASGAVPVPSSGLVNAQRDWAERFASEPAERPNRGYDAKSQPLMAREGLRELQYLLLKMQPEDIERLLDYARRLRRS